MNAKHLTKYAMSHKLVFFSVGIAFAIIAAFSICATSQAKAMDNQSYDGILTTKNGGTYSINYGGKPSIKGNFDAGDFDVLGVLPDPIKKNFSNIAVAQQYNPSDSNELGLFFDFVLTNWERGEISFICKVNSGELGSCDTMPEIPLIGADEEGDPIDFTYNQDSYFILDEITSGINISGRVLDAQNNMPVPFANVVYCQYNPWGDMYLPVEGVEPVKTDMWGGYNIEGITEEMLPGKVFVYDGIKKIGESEPIWFFPEDMETLYMWPIVINQEQPDPPVPPTPPDPPVPPGPVPPEPVPPVPPTPVPTPDNPGGGIAQTSDNTVSALVIFAMVALLGAGVLTGRKLYNR